MKALIHEAHIAATRHPMQAALLTRLANLVQEQQREIEALRAAVSTPQRDSYYDCPFTLVLHGKRCVLSRRHKCEHELVRINETNEEDA